MFFLGDLLELIAVVCIAVAAFLVIGVIGVLVVVALFLGYQAHLGPHATKPLPQSRIRRNR